MRILLLVVVIVLVFLIVRSLLRQAARTKQRAARIDGPERMVRCARCGLHVPEQESVRDDEGRHYCCDEHRRGSD